jgi:hypothetical protein
MNTINRLAGIEVPPWFAAACLVAAAVLGWLAASDPMVGG